MISPVVSLRPWNKRYQIAQKNEEMLRTDQGVVKLAMEIHVQERKTCISNDRIACRNRWLFRVQGMVNKVGLPWS
jgi:hypothetical protein